MNIHLLLDYPQFNKNIFTADVFFLYINNNIINRRFFNFPKYLVNIPNLQEIKHITDKKMIINEIDKINPNIVKKYIPETFNISQINKYKFPNWYILRPIDSFGGEGIKYINNLKDLNKAIEYYNITKEIRNFKPAQRI